MTRAQGKQEDYRGTQGTRVRAWVACVRQRYAEKPSVRLGLAYRRAQGSIPTASTWASISCSWSLACRFNPRSLQVRDQIASIECLLEELKRFTYAMVVQSRPLRGDDRDHIISIFGATA